MKFKGKQAANWVATSARSLEGEGAVLGGSNMNLIDTFTQAWMDDAMPMYATVRLVGGETRSLAMVAKLSEESYQVIPMPGFEKFVRGVVDVVEIAEGLLEAGVQEYLDYAQENAEDWQGSISQLTRRFNQLDIV